MMHCKSSLSFILACLAFTGCSSKKPGAVQSQDQSKDQGVVLAETNDKSSNGGAQTNDVVQISADAQRRVGILLQAVVTQQVARALSVAGQVQMDEEHTSHLG